MAKLLHIVSTHRSGSTLLGRMLARRFDAFYAGQLEALPHMRRPDLAACSCGQTLLACSFWGPLIRATDKEDLQFGLMGLPLGASRFDSAVQRATLLTRRRSALPADPRIRRLIDFAGRVGETARVPVVIDSSKTLRLARSVWDAAPERTLVVHLVRNVRAVAFSRRRAEGRDIRSSSLAWARDWVAAQAMYRLLPRNQRVFVRYESLCEAPERVLDEIGQRFDLRPRPFPDAEHIAFGNPSRMSDIGSVVEDRSWQHAWTRDDEAAVHPAARLLEILRR